MFLSHYGLSLTLKGIIVVGIFAFISSYIILYIINKIIKFRTNEENEIEGLDVIECGIESYPEFKRTF